jgi:hypothetical protein
MRRMGEASSVNPVAVAPPAAPSPTITIERLILDVLAYLELARGLSRNTLEA